MSCVFHASSHLTLRLNVRCRKCLDLLRLVFSGHVLVSWEHGPSQVCVAKLLGRCELLVEQGGRTPDLRIANAGPYHKLLF